MISNPQWTASAVPPDNTGTKSTISLGKAYDIFIEPIQPKVPAKDDDVGYGHYNTYLTITKLLLLEALLEDRNINEIFPTQGFTLSSTNCLAKLLRKSPLCGDEEGEDLQLAQEFAMSALSGLQIAIDNSESLADIAIKTADMINEHAEMNLTPDEKTELEMAFKCQFLHRALAVGIISQYEKKAVIFDGPKEEVQKKWYDMLEKLSKEHGYPGPIQVKQALQNTMRSLPETDFIQL